MDDLAEHIDAIDNLYSSHTDAEVLTNFNQDLRLEDANLSSQEESQVESEIKLAPKEFDENEYHSDEEREKNKTKNFKDNDRDKKPVAEEEEEEEKLPIERNDEWRSQSKHVFILSEAGKPIYSLHGSEDDLVTFMGLLQALVSIIECDEQNSLRHVVSGEHKIVFMHRTHLILVNVSKEPDICVEQLELELNYCYSQILSIVTLGLINKIFNKHHNYDLRNKLTGTEKLLTNIVNRVHNDYGMLLNCVNSYPLQHETREQISRLIAQHISPLRYVIFGLLLFDNKLVSLIRPKTKNIHPIDVHLLVNVITGLDSLKTADFTWYPICLPNFDSNGIMYAYISHLDDACKTCLILLTGSCGQEQSTELNACREKIQQKLVAMNLMQALSSKIKDNALRLEQIQIPELKHFLFKDNKVFQYFVSEYASPYAQSVEQQQRVFNMYQMLFHKLHNKTNMLRIIYMQKKYETILGWVTSNFEIYATFSPLVTKDIAIRAINKLLDFTQRNKTKIFMSAMPTIQR